MENSNLKQKDITVFAETTFRNKKERFGIKEDDRRRHVYLIGKTGMGKSTMMENMIYQDIHAGRGVALADPHGDFVEKILDYIPANRINDVVYFNPADLNNPVSFNILESLDPKTRHIVASGLVGVFKKLWADSWGPRLEYLLRNAILALMETPNSTILGVTRVLIDKNFRKKIVENIQDPIVKSFWTEEYSKYTASFQVEAISPIQNKVGQFISTPLIRNIIGQVKSSFDIRDVMDNKKILLMNLSKGRIGEDASALLGAMMITKIQLAAMERVNIPEEEREDFYLYVDEFQNFATESFADILSEARKYRLCLTLTNQYIEQLDEKVQAAIFGNVGTLISFRVGPTDAEILEKEFAPKFTEEDLINLTKYNIYIKLMIDGVASDPFSAKGLPPLAKKEGNAEKIIRVSRERFGNSKEEIEAKIIKWAESGTSREKKNIPTQKKSDNKTSINNSRKKDSKVVEKNIQNKTSAGFDVTCSYCGVNTTIPFKPDGVRPVFCKDCLQKMRDKELIMDKNHKGEYIITKEPKTSVKKDGMSLDDIRPKKQNILPEKEKEDVLPKISPPKINKKPFKQEDDNILKPGKEIKF